MIAISVRNSAELAAAIAKLPAELRTRILRILFREAGWEACAAVAGRVPVRTGALREALTVTEHTVGGVPQVRVRPLPGPRRQRHAHLVEFGTTEHDITTSWGRGGDRTIHHPGARARPFFWPAIEGLADALQDRIIAEIEDEVARWWEAQR